MSSLAYLGIFNLLIFFCGVVLILYLYYSSATPNAWEARVSRVSDAKCLHCRRLSLIFLFIYLLNVFVVVHSS